MKPTIWMCSGQGAQYWRMGEALYTADPVFREALHRCDDIVRPHLGCTLSGLLYGPRTEQRGEFDRTVHTGPAIVAVQYAMACTLKARGLAPDAVLGYSLGEISAAVIAEALPLADGLVASIALARVLRRHTDRGGMLAILAPPALLAERPQVFSDTWVAAENFPRHVVISGSSDAVARVEATLAAEEIVTARLPVEYPFHCPLIDPAEPGMVAHFNGLSAKTPSLTLLSAQRRGKAADLSAQGLWAVVRQPVPFTDTVTRLERNGGADYIDLGPSGTLATFVKYNLAADSPSRVASTLTPFAGSTGEPVFQTAR